MVTIKSYTDLEQSKKLAEILPLESADMYYFRQIDNDYFPPNIESICPIPLFKDGKEDFNYDIRCWSLAALLDVLPVIIGDVLSENALRLRMDKSETEFTVWYENLDSGMVEEGFDIIKSSPVDACYEMILKLHELKLL